MKSKWQKKQIHNWKHHKPMTKKEATQIQTMICMILFVVIIVGLIVKEIIVKEVWF